VRILVVQPDAGCPADRYTHWLAEAGAELVQCRPFGGDEVPLRAEADALIVLGGHMAAWDDDQHAWLAPARRLLERSVTEGLPVLGICLGAQLLAAACGGRVEVGRHGIQAGVLDVRWRPDARTDPLVAGLPDPFPAPSMNRDVVTSLPAEAIWLGESDVYPHQAFRVGRCAWGLQFHPEVSVPGYGAWRALVAAEDWHRSGVDGDEVVDQLRRRDAEVAAAGRRLAHRFVAVANH
jgi:GMP synthase (glutamine-hydrolysing)